MTAKTTKDVPEGVAAADEEATATGTGETAEAEAAGKPKRKRRVRVIEVIEDDDEDLEDVLEALDAEEIEEAEEPAPKPKPKPAAKKPVLEKPVAEKPVVKSAADEEEPAPRPTLFGLGRPQAIAAIVVIAVLASLAVWQWRTAAALQADKDDRAAVAKIAAAYGDVAASYNAANYQEQMRKAQELMGGDLLEKYRSTTVPSLAGAFKSNPNASLTSKTVGVTVGEINGRFATAVVTVDISGTAEKGTSRVPANLIRLALAKIDGKWKVTRQYASGEDDATQAQNQSGGGLTPGVPGAGTAPQPSTGPKKN
ncbi:hypothetical protein [Actinomadura macrotermitis]|uniref:Mce-associated membrane protein n=1 Tax=Actinomadura macrotermitis TaxID=2585200 RepID=A0A7K0C1J1_9ACTN|nr:hypothetical protein [Actinomadura macrotermitis]MQY06654.1 hypothetical protein [Actinomadura macrotermitis]